MLSYSSFTPVASFTVSGKVKQREYNVVDYLAIADGIVVTDAAITSGHNTLTSASAKFKSSDVGKKIVVQGAGTSGAYLNTTIASFTSSSSVNSTANASTTVTNANAAWGTSNATLINNALTACHNTGGGTVIIPYFGTGQYNIEAPLVIYSNTTLLIDPSVTIYEWDGVNKNMLVDYAHYSGDLTVPSVMHDIHVLGGIWNRYTPSDPQSSNNSHSIILGGDNVSFEDYQFYQTGGIGEVIVQNTTNFSVKRGYYHGARGEAVKVGGPAHFGVIDDIRGSTGDDMIAILPADQSFVNFGNEGDITDLEISNIFPELHNTSCEVKISSGSTNNGATPLNTKRIKVSNIIGTRATGVDLKAAVFIGDAADDVNLTLGNIDDIIVDNIQVSMPGGGGFLPIEVYGIPTSKTIPKLTFRNINVSADCTAVVYHLHPSVTSMIIDSVQGGTTSAAALGIVFLEQYYSGISRLKMSSIDFTNFAQGGNVIREAVNNTVTLDEVEMSNCYFNNVSSLTYLDSITKFYLSNVRLVNNQTIFTLNTDSSVIVESCSGLVADTNTSSFSGSSTIESKALGMPLNITSSSVVKNNGDACTTIATAGSINTGSQVIYDSTNGHWYKLANQTTY